MNQFIRKSWYTLTEAAEYLTQNTQGEVQVTTTNLLQLAAEGDVTITLQLFSMAPAAVGDLVVLVNLDDKNGHMEGPPNAHVKFCTDEQHREFVQAGAVIEHGPPTVIFEEWKSDADIKHEVDILPIASGRAFIQALWRKSLQGTSEYSDQLTKTTARDDPQLSERPIFLNVPDPEIPRTARTTLSDLPDDTFLGITRENLDLLLEGNTGEHADGPTSQQTASYNQLPEDFRALINSMGKGDQPNLDLLIAAWRTHWKNRTKNDGKPYPQNDDVIKWIMDRMDGNESKIMATYIAKIIRPQWAPKHRPPTKEK